MQIQCPSCQRMLRVKDSVTAETVSCPHCKSRIPLKTNLKDRLTNVLNEERQHETIPHCPNTIPLKKKQADKGGAQDLLTALLGEVKQLEAAPSVAVAAPMSTSIAVEAPPTSPAPRPAAPKKKREKPSKGHFPHRTSKAYQKDHDRGPMMAVIFGVIIVAVVAYAAIYFIRTGIRTQSIRVALKSAQDMLPSVKAQQQAGDDLLAKEDYKGALDAYRKVISTAQPLMNRLQDVSGALQSGKLNDQVQTVSAELNKYLTYARDKSEDPNVKFPAQGLVDFDGDWVTPEQKAAAIEAKNRAEGRQLYEGKWLTENEIHKAKGEVLYKGQWVTLEVLEELRKTTPTVAVKPPEPEPAPVPTPTVNTAGFKPTDLEWTLDDFEKPAIAWSAVRWNNANPCTLTQAKFNNKGSNQLRIQLAGGQQDKSAIVCPMKLDFTSRKRLRMDVTNNTGEPLRIAIAIQTNTYYESRWIDPPLRPGVNKNVSFNLQTGDFKCATTNWSPASRIKKLEGVTDIFILFYNRTGEIFLDNISVLNDG